VESKYNVTLSEEKYIVEHCGFPIFNENKEVKLCNSPFSSQIESEVSIKVWKIEEHLL